MNKKVWVRPVTEVQQFEANEYVAACGDGGVWYNFECNAPGGTLYYYPDKSVDKTIDGEYTGTGEAVRLGSYSPCEAKHEASATDDFYDGYIVNSSFWGGSTTRKVIVWRGENGRNGHATAELDMDAWEISKS